MLQMENSIKIDAKKINWATVDGVIWLKIGFCGVVLQTL
jgi:hypothetical protein